MFIGEIIKQYRITNHISQRAFAARTSLSPSYINTLEKIYNPKTKKPYSITTDVAKEISNALFIPMEQLLAMLDDTQESNYFEFKVQDDSMSPVLIEEGIVIVKKQSNFENGDIVVFMINEKDIVIRKVKKTENSILFQPLNSDYEPLIFIQDEFKSLPVVLGIVKHLKRDF